MPIITPTGVQTARATTGATAKKKKPSPFEEKRRAQGVDISHWQYQINPQNASVPLDFVIYKASESTFKDKRLDQHYQSTKNVPIKGAYHFLSVGNVNAQVNAFLDAVSGKALDFFAVDVENNDVTGSKINAVMAQDAREFRRQVEQRTGKPVFLYTNESLLNQYFNRPGDENIPLWFAQPNKSWTNPQLPSGRSWAIWQNAWDAPASAFGLSRYDRGVDFNVFAGTPEDMKAYIQSLTTGKAFNLSQSAARSSGSLSSSGAAGISETGPVSPPQSKYADMLAPSASVPGSTFAGTTLPQSIKTTGAINALAPKVSPTPGPAGPTVADTVKNAIYGDKSKTGVKTTPGIGNVTAGAGAIPAAPEDKTSPFEKFFGIDLASLGFVVVGVVLVVVGLVLMFRRADAPEGG